MRFWGIAGKGKAGTAGGPGKAAAAGDSAAEDAARRVLSERLVELGLQVVHEGRGPMRLWEFSYRLSHRLGMPPMRLGELSDAVKATLANSRRFPPESPRARHAGGRLRLRRTRPQHLARPRVPLNCGPSIHLTACGRTSGCHGGVF